MLNRHPSSSKTFERHKIIHCCLAVLLINMYTYLYTYTFILKEFIGSGVFAYSSEDLNTIVVHSAFNINWDNKKISKNKTTRRSFIYLVNNFSYLIRFEPISHIAVYVSERQILYHFTQMNAIHDRHRPIRGRSIL